MGSYPSAEKQSVYSTAPANWALFLSNKYNIDGSVCEVRVRSVVYNITYTLGTETNFLLLDGNKSPSHPQSKSESFFELLGKILFLY